MARIILGIGMHNGDDTHYYVTKGFRVVAVEAIPDLAESAAKRFASEISSGRVIIENVGITDSANQTTFYINHANTVQSSFVQPPGEIWTQVRVQTTKLSDLIQKHGTPDLLKLDIEHYDLRALHDLRANDILPKYISVEAHSVDIILTLWSMGYRRFRLVNGKTVSAVFGTMKIRTLSGGRVAFAFNKHSSGPYGDDIIPYLWVDIETLMAIWNNRITLLSRGWFDVHAALPADNDDMFLG